MKKQPSYLDLLKEIKNFNISEEKKYNKEHCMTLKDRIYGWLKGLHYEGVEDWRVRCDFKYMKKNGHDNLLSVLMKHPVFEYEVDLKKGVDFYSSKNWGYFMFLFDKANFRKLWRKGF